MDTYMFLMGRSLTCVVMPHVCVLFYQITTNQSKLAFVGVVQNDATAQQRYPVSLGIG